MLPRLFLTFLVSIFLSSNVYAEEKWFAHGYLEGGITPPHNEIELGLRRPDSLGTNGFGNNFARYAVRGQIFVGRQLNHQFVQEVYVAVFPYFVFGDTIPQLNYTWSPDYIGHANNWAIGLTLPKGWKVFMEHHGRWSFSDTKAVHYGRGPYGLYNGIFVRKELDFKF